MQSRLTRRISLTILAMAVLVSLLNLLAYSFYDKLGLLQTLAKPQLWLLLLFILIFALSRFLPSTFVQVLQVVSILLLSGPTTMASPFTFFGMWFFVLGIILLYKYGFLNHGAPLKLLLVSVYFLPFLVFSVLTNEGLTGSTIRVANYAIFLVSCLAFLYFIFEEELRDLLASNRTKDAELAVKESELTIQAAEIARLEPLTVLGERVAHVAHSFKTTSIRSAPPCFIWSFSTTKSAPSRS